MTPQQLVDYLETRGIGRKEFADRLGVTESAISFWLREGYMAYDRQCHVEKELRGSKLRADWDDIPANKRPVPTA
jgi:transcriptional regulator with XRE-family HTH domain